MAGRIAAALYYFIPVGAWVVYVHSDYKSLLDVIFTYLLFWQASPHCRGELHALLLYGA